MFSKDNNLTIIRLNLSIMTNATTNSLLLKTKTTTYINIHYEQQQQQQQKNDYFIKNEWNKKKFTENAGTKMKLQEIKKKNVKLETHIFM